MAKPWRTLDSIDTDEGLLDLRQRGETDFLITINVDKGDVRQNISCAVMGSVVERDGSSGTSFNNFLIDRQQSYKGVCS